MNTHRKSSTALAALMAMILAVPTAAWADAGGDDDHGHGGRKGGDKTNAHYNIHYHNRYDGHYAGKAPYHPGYYVKAPSYPRYYPRYYPQPYPAYPCNNCGSAVAFSAMGSVPTRTAMPRVRAAVRRRSARQRYRHRPSTQPPRRSIPACSNASTTPRLWSVANRWMGTARPACSRMARGATARPNRNPTNAHGD
jgi:hypothetical protein